MNIVYGAVAVVVIAGAAFYFLAGSPSEVPGPDAVSNPDVVAPRESAAPAESAPASAESESDPAPESTQNDAAADVVIESDTTAQVDDSEVSVEQESSAGAEVAIDLTGRSFEFSQSEIRVNEGDTVTINFTSTGGLHDWVVDEFSAATGRVGTGGNTSVTFVADSAGSYEYYCSVGSHRAQGMVGTLIVE